MLTLTYKSMSCLGPVTPIEGCVSSSRGNVWPGASSMSRRCNSMAKKINTSCFAMTRPGQYVDPPPKGRYDALLARALFFKNRSGSKQSTELPHTSLFECNTRCRISTSAPGWSSLPLMVIGDVTPRTDTVPPPSRSASKKADSKSGQDDKR